MHPAQSPLSIIVGIMSPRSSMLLAASAAEHAVCIGRGKQYAIAASPWCSPRQAVQLAGTAPSLRAISAITSEPVQAGAQSAGRQQSSSSQTAPAHSPGPAAGAPGARLAAAQSTGTSFQLRPIGLAQPGSSSVEPPPQAQQPSAGCTLSLLA